MIDQIYLGGTAGNAGDDPLAALLPVGNQGGFRYAGGTSQTVVVRHAGVRIRTHVVPLDVFCARILASVEAVAADIAAGTDEREAPDASNG